MVIRLAQEPGGISRVASALTSPPVTSRCILPSGSSETSTQRPRYDRVGKEESRQVCQELCRRENERLHQEMNPSCGTPSSLNPSWHHVIDTTSASCTPQLSLFISTTLWLGLMHVPGAVHRSILTGSTSGRVPSFLSVQHLLYNNPLGYFSLAVTTLVAFPWTFDNRLIHWCLPHIFHIA